MGRFSLEIEAEDDGDGPSSPRPKKPRFTPKSCFNLFGNDEGEESSQHHHEEEEEEEEDDDEEEELVSEQQEVEDEDEAEEEEVEEDDEEEDRVQSSNDGGNVPDRKSTTRSKVDGSISVTLTDPDVLECPICLEPLTIPVFQCENGHVACSCCCSKLRNKCPSCSFPIGYNRCRAIEKVLESLKISCRNAKYGCKDLVIYSKVRDHENTCLHLPCTCPHLNCHFTAGPQGLYRHVRLRHADSVTRFRFDTFFPVSLETDKKYLILQEKDEDIIFILSRAVDRLGSLVNVNGIGPSLMKNFSYDLVAKNGSCSVRLQSLTESFPNWRLDTPRKAFLLVPREIGGARKRLELEICVWRENGRYMMSK